jgi:hypothetical protein
MAMIHYLDTEKFKHQAEWYEQALSVYQLLPKHSESFGEWRIEQTEHSLRFNGCYFLSEWTQSPEHTILFTLILPKDVEKSFKIQFNGEKSQKLSRRFRIRSYLESEIIESLYGDTTGIEFMIGAGFLSGWDDLA